VRLLAGRYADRAGLVLLSVGADGGCRVEQELPETGNVSYAAWSTPHRKLYAVREEDHGAIDLLVPDDGWRIAATVPTAGAKPCHCALDQSERWLAVANYQSGSVSVFALDAEGIPQGPPWRFLGEGSGPVAERQEGPHAHWVGFAPDQRALVAADLGADVVRVFGFDAGRGMLDDGGIAMAAPEGSGPRWLRFGPGPADVLLVSELDSTLALCTWANRQIRERERRSTRAPHATGQNLAGHLAVSARGDRVYLTNRGDDAVSLFAVESGHLKFLGSAASGGESPRYLCLLEERALMLVGHEKAGPIAVFDVSGDRIRRIGDCDVGAVAWIGRAPASRGSSR
jgi:6-phosphogluconolactonase